jgi:hypothetical protein
MREESGSPVADSIVRPVYAQVTASQERVPIRTISEPQPPDRGILREWARFDRASGLDGSFCFFRKRCHGSSPSHRQTRGHLPDQAHGTICQSTPKIVITNDQIGENPAKPDCRIEAECVRPQRCRGILSGQPLSLARRRSRAPSPRDHSAPHNLAPRRRLKVDLSR